MEEYTIHWHKAAHVHLNVFLYPFPLGMSDTNVSTLPRYLRKYALEVLASLSETNRVIGNCTVRSKLQFLESG